jgi:hypothetical protein
MNSCPFCQWPSIAVTRDPALDSVGNEYFHGNCKQCKCEVIYFRKSNS